MAALASAPCSPIRLLSRERLSTTFAVGCLKVLALLANPARGSRELKSVALNAACRSRGSLDRMSCLGWG